jgi:hypothetical protein
MPPHSKKQAPGYEARVRVETALRLCAQRKAPFRLVVYRGDVTTALPRRDVTVRVKLPLGVVHDDAKVIDCAEALLQYVGKTMYSSGSYCVVHAHVGGGGGGGAGAGEEAKEEEEVATRVSLSYDHLPEDAPSGGFFSGKPDAPLLIGDVEATLRMPGE